MDTLRCAVTYLDAADSAIAEQIAEAFEKIELGGYRSKLTRRVAS
jgi:hypothetical protein